MRRTLAPALLVVLAVACAPGEKLPQALTPHSVVRELGLKIAVPDPPAPREDGRLPPLASPLRYGLSLNIEPTSERFSGTTTILVSVPQPTWHVVLHARDLRISRVAARVAGEPIEGSATSRAAAGARTSDELVLTFARALPAGEASIDLAFEGTFARDLRALYRVKEDGRWYAFTQFEPSDARRAFPCFDEPAYKTPFDVQLVVPKDSRAFSNAPESSRQETAGGQTVRFESTAPLPTYLVAFAVGDLDVREGATKPVPIRLISAKGKSGLGQLALSNTEEIVARLSDYFGTSYPYPKLDVVAVPDFSSGAMENAGLVTFREELLLLDPVRASAQARRSQAYVIAHEIAHHWFGDLVTTSWWNDLWLNEGMAKWMESRALDPLHPSWGTRLDAAASAQDVMNADALISARKIRQPVVSTDDAQNAFDGITYQKGAAVLGMLEQWLGEKTFQQGVRDYVREHAWKNAVADDLFGALGRASRKDVRALAATFVDQTGVPLVDAHLECEPGNRWRVELSQEPWRPVGSAAPESHAPWTIPVCIHADGQREAVCAELAAGAPSIAAGTGRCPQWIHPNAGSSGYYRFALPAKELAALAKSAPSLEPIERLTVVSNLWAQARAGRLDFDVVLKTLPSFDRETERHVVDQVIAVLHSMSDAVVEDGARPAFRAYAAARLGAHKKRLGWAPGKPAKPDDDERALSRTNVLRAMAELAEDEETMREAEEHAASWLRDPSRVHPDVAAIALEIASRKAGAERLEALRGAMKNAKVPQDRVMALRAIGNFGEKDVLTRGLGLLLTDEVKLQDVRSLFGSAMSHRVTRAVTVQWVKANWDALRAKLPGPLSTRLVGIAGAVCTPAERDELEAFLRPRAKTMDAAIRPLDESLETASLCVALRAKGAPTVTKYFAKK
jgi:aminopeptidase N